MPLEASTPDPIVISISPLALTGDVTRIPPTCMLALVEGTRGSHNISIST
jgi:hypothetical protein